MFNKPTVMDKNPLKPTVIIFGKTLRISKLTQKAALFMAVTNTNSFTNRQGNCQRSCA